MATRASIASDARKRLRDFPKFFQASFSPAGRTYELGKPNIDEESLWVAFVPGGSGASAGASVVAPGQYAVDSRGGYLRFGNQPVADKILVEGYYYEWLLPEDMEFAADLAIHNISHNLSVPVADIAPAVADVFSLRTIVEALWTLLNEYARDIDVITSESVHIIASQRYRMVQSLLREWQEEYNKAAAALNIGLDRMEVFTLRKVSMRTGALVPIYKPREVGDFVPVERIWTPIDSGTIDLEEQGDDLRTDVYVDGDPPPAYGPVGWGVW